MFKAILITKHDAQSRASIVQMPESELPGLDVDVDVEYSTLNYKDALAITGRGAVVRKFPMIPGIDMAGVVAASRDAKFEPGDRVLLNGWGRGEVVWGGLSQKARAAPGELMHVPEGMTTRSAMSIGTAGYTAALCVLALLRHGLKPEDGDVLVTGANGGVGGFAIALLSAKGYRVIASSGRLEQADRLRALGAADVIDRAELTSPGKPLQKERWVAAVDSVGSHTLANACAATKYRGIVAACGLAQGLDFPSTVAPFILRGVTLVGVESSQTPIPERVAAWKMLEGTLPPETIEAMTTGEFTLEESIHASHELLDGKIVGRVIVKVA